jgi:MFS family permease
MAKCIEENKKGKASGWYQAGCLVGLGFGGGAGLWLASHYNVVLAGITLCIASFVCAPVIFLIKDVHYAKKKPILHEITGMGKDIFAMLKVPVTLFVIILLMMPIGSGAAANLWSAIAQDWKTGPDTVALVTGVLSGLVSALGCVAGGFITDKWGIWVAYLGSGLVCALVTLIMALLPMQPVVYIGGVLTYTFGIGLINAAFTAVILYAIGKKHVATKYSLLSSLGNLPVVYMTAFDGWAHDRFNSKYMLVVEAAVGFLFVVLFLLALKQMKNKKMIPSVIE